MSILSGTVWIERKEFGFWLRIFGKGIAASNAKPLFSERNGYRKCVRIFGIKFELLK